MSTPNEMDEVFVMLPELALGMLPADEAARLMAVVQSSPKLQAELASLRGTANALGSAATPAPIAPAKKSAMRDRLVARAAASTTSDATGADDARAAVPTPVSVPTLRLESSEPSVRPIIREVQVPARLSLAQRGSPYIALAASLMAVWALYRGNTAMQQRDAMQSALFAANATTTQMTTQLAVSDSLVAAMSGANVRVVDMVSTQKLAPGAKMFWDRLANRWTMVTHDLPQVQAGRTYQLWLVTAKAEKISAGTFNTDAKGRAVVQATYPLAEADLAAIAITEEPTGGSPQPTGTILVAGAATR